MTDGASEGTKAKLRHFCTYFDSNYLASGLTLYRSLSSHIDDLQLWVLCMDRITHHVLSTLDLAGVIPISIDAFEAGDDRLMAAKEHRSRVEYYFTCTPSLPRYVLKKWPSVPHITYLDADLYFLGSPSLLTDEIGDKSITIHPHRFPPGQAHRAAAVGEYNVGLVSFRNDETGRDCIRWWRNRCLEWCYDRKEDGKFADQKYLDEWPSLFDGVCVLSSPGAGLARWNVDQYDLCHNGEHVTIDGDPLVFYHFEGLDRLTHWLWDPRVELTPVLESQVYKPYIRARRRAEQTALSVIDEPVTSGSIRRGLVVSDDSPAMNVLRTGYRLTRLLAAALHGNLVVCRK
jgi:hypothetical protein